MKYTYAHHFFARGCELAGCDAPTRECDLYLVEGERRAVRACCGAHAKAAATREEIAAEAEREAEEFYEGLDAFDTWARCEACGELAEPKELEEFNGVCAGWREEAGR